MIKASFDRNLHGKICGFTVEDHGEDLVCSAVSALALNAINSVEAFTEEFFICEMPDAGTGFIRLDLPDLQAGGENKDVDLLLSSLALGLNAIAEEYPQQLTVCEVILNA